MRKGYKHTQEAIEKNRQAHIGKRVWNKGLKGETYKNHYKKGMGGTFKNNHSPWHKGKTDIYSKETLKKMSEAKKGKSSWNKGKKMPKQSPETIEKRRLSLIGKKRTIEQRRVLSESKKGSKNYAWKGGISPIHERIRNSLEMKLWRTAVFERDNYTCIWCGTKKSPFNADHIKPFAYFPELRFAIDNGRTLCISCHKKTDTYGVKAKKYKI